MNLVADSVGLTRQDQPSLPIHGSRQIATSEPYPPLAIRWVINTAVANHCDFWVPRPFVLVGFDCSQELIEKFENRTWTVRDRQAAGLRKNTDTAPECLDRFHQFDAAARSSVLKVASGEREQSCNHHDQIGRIRRQNRVIGPPAIGWSEQFGERE
ncbi:MAG: hypothetical protein P4L99_25700 [Chthoniobacter sp.]|nr:hypothetical protein [Chthoniobacter sp.]